MIRACLGFILIFIVLAVLLGTFPILWLGVILLLGIYFLKTS